MSFLVGHTSRRSTARVHHSREGKRRFHGLTVSTVGYRSTPRGITPRSWHVRERTLIFYFVLLPGPLSPPCMYRKTAILIFLESGNAIASNQYLYIII